MRHIILLLLFCMGGPIAQAQLETGIASDATSTESLKVQNYEMSVGMMYAQPGGLMRGQIPYALGLQTQIMYLFPNMRLAVGVEGGHSNYSKIVSRQSYLFEDGTTASAEVTARSSLSNFSLVSRFNLRKEGLFTPYIISRAGIYTFNTHLTIEDTDDEDDCAPLLECTNLFRSVVPVVSAGAGVSVNLSRFFNKDNDVKINFTTQYTRGGQARYMNVDIAPSSPETHAHSQGNGEATPYFAPFINTVSKVEHAHHVGDVYQSPIRFLEFTVSLVIRLKYDPSKTTCN